MKDIVVMGIDPSLSSSGICLLSQRGTVIHATSLTHSLEDPERLRYIHDSLISLMTSYSPTHIVYERQVPQMRYAYSSGSIIPLAELAGILKLAILRYKSTASDLNVYRIPPEDIKKYATGNSKAEKEDMIRAVPQRSINKINSIVLQDSVNDVADAYHAARMILDLSKSEDGRVTCHEKEFLLSQYYYITKQSV